MHQARLTWGAALLATALATPGDAAAPRFPLGAYLGNPNSGSAAAEAAFEASYATFAAALRTPPSLIVTYVDYAQPVANWPANASWQAYSNRVSPDAHRLLPVIGLPMASIAAGSALPDQQFRAFAAGTYDSEIRGVVAAWAQQGFHTLAVRPGWEMNIPGNTFAGSDAQSQADWVGAFRHIYRVLHAAAASNNVSLRVLWNPNITNYDNYGTRTALYPGNDFVDVIGADIYADMYPYSDGGNPPTYHDWATGGEDTSVAQFIANPVNRRHYWSWPAATRYNNDSSQGHNLSLSVLIGFAKQHGKPFAVPEAGAGNCDAGRDVCDDPTFPAWLASRLQAAANNGGPIAFVDVWNSNGGGNYEFSFAADGKPLEAAAWGHAFGPH